MQMHASLPRSFATGTVGTCKFGVALQVVVLWIAALQGAPY